MLIAAFLICLLSVWCIVELNRPVSGSKVSGGGSSANRRIPGKGGYRKNLWFITHLV